MKDFTLYPEALGLKEIGFDEPCFGRYNNNDDYLLIAHTEKYIISNVVDRSEFFILAPLYSQAFRWFRDNYNLLCYIRKIGSSYWYNIDAEDGSTLDNEFEGRFDTYEEAEHACLRKLIKIIKESKK